MIDKATVGRIMDAANIVEVVSEFVTLRRSGANYKGLCPFHNEKTPSFIVTPSRNTCHCFGCGKGGNPVNFIMEHEQMTYPEALRWLANKYHIEVQERELSKEEREAENDRESMFIVNERAAKYFEDILHNNVDGLAIGMQYLRKRGFRDDIIRKFRLGYDLSQVDALPNQMLKEGFKEKYLMQNPDTGVGVGLCYKSERDGKLIDRFAGRIVFPWFSLSGKVVGFNARKLDSATKGVQQKYVNSPASIIYQKERELYGIHLAKKAMTQENNVFVVEGQTDVISMHQCGIENVVAGSGTAFSVHQTRMLRRFTNNITLIYDNDNAGKHAAMERIDMMLPEGINVRLLFLPEGEDPDSFARNHTAADFKKYIEENQKDCIQFKIDFLLKGVTDPVKRSEAINSIIRSLSLIPDNVVRATYIHDTAFRLGMSEQVIINQMNKMIRAGKEKGSSQPATQGETSGSTPPTQTPLQPATPLQRASMVEKMLVQMIVRHGEDIIYRDLETDDGNTINLNVAQYIAYDLGQDALSFSNPLFNRILDEAVLHSADEGFKAESFFLNHEDVEISKIANMLSVDQVQLSKSLQLSKDDDGLREQVIHLILDFRMDYVEEHLKELKAKFRNTADVTEQMNIMQEIKDMQEIRNALAKRLGKNIVNI
ncbi:MAG: DNA primase [Prevotella sp.]|jgi:DNA primase|nr:DNA primase [Prevotella sp.]